MVRERVEGLIDIDLRVGAHAGFLHHAHGRNAGLAGLPGERDHLELDVQQLAEIIRRAQRCVRQIA